MTTLNWTSEPAAIDRFGAAVARRLSDGIDDLPHDITERLRAARARAVANRQVSNVSPTMVAGNISVSGGEAVLHHDDDEDSIWSRIGAFLPLLALVIGLVAIVVIQDEVRVRELAELDAELLTDELPPSAYVDPGFTQFIRSNQQN